MFKKFVRKKGRSLGVGIPDSAFLLFGGWVRGRVRQNQRCAKWWLPLCAACVALFLKGIGPFLVLKIASSAEVLLFREDLWRSQVRIQCLPPRKWVSKGVRAARLQNEIASEKCLNRYKKWFEKHEKGSEKRSETCPKNLKPPHAA